MFMRLAGVKIFMQRILIPIMGMIGIGCPAFGRLKTKAVKRSLQERGKEKAGMEKLIKL